MKRVTFDPTKAKPPQAFKGPPAFVFNDQLIHDILAHWREQGVTKFMARDLYQALLDQGCEFPRSDHYVKASLGSHAQTLGYAKIGRTRYGFKYSTKKDT